jgi:hypothetical protein
MLRAVQVAKQTSDIKKVHSYDASGPPQSWTVKLGAETGMEEGFWVGTGHVVRITVTRGVSVQLKLHRPEERVRVERASFIGKVFDVDRQEFASVQQVYDLVPGDEFVLGSVVSVLLSNDNSNPVELLFVIERASV